VPQTIARWRYSGKVVQLAFILGKTSDGTHGVRTPPSLRPPLLCRGRFIGQHLQSPAMERQKVTSSVCFTVRSCSTLIHSDLRHEVGGEYEIGLSICRLRKSRKQVTLCYFAVTLMNDHQDLKPPNDS